MLPRLVVNLKTYPEATGLRAVKLARAARAVERSTGVGVAVAAQAVDLRACAAAGARVFAQHLDRIESSQSTGAQRWECLMAAGAMGSLINHSERRLDPRIVEWCVAQVNGSKKTSLVCAQDAAESKRLARFAPTLIAVEPPELIGGDVSVTTADPGIIRRSVDAVHGVKARLPVLCGAGVKDGDDAAAARKLGAYGILVASGVVKAARPARIIDDLARSLA